MPPVGLLIGGVNFSDLKITLKEAVMKGGAEVTPAVTLNYGNFIQTTLDFIIIALAIFLFGKGYECPQQKEERGTESSGCSSGRHPTAHGNQRLTEKENKKPSVCLRDEANGRFSFYAEKVLSAIQICAF